MNKLIKFCLFSSLILPLAAIADNLQHEMMETEIIVENSDGDGNEHDGDENIVMNITVDENGNMKIEKSIDGKTWEVVDATSMIGGKKMAHVMEFAHSQHRDHGQPQIHTLSPHADGQRFAMAYSTMDRVFEHPKMSDDAATCILKNISKVNVDAAARLLKQACINLNPAHLGSDSDQ